MRTPTLLALSLALTWAIGGCSDFSAEDSQEQADIAIGGGWLWPKGDVFVIVDTEDPGWLEFWGDPALGEEGLLALQNAAENLARETPVRIHIVSKASESTNGYVAYVGGQEGGGRSNVGTFGASWFTDLNLVSDPRSMPHELGHLLGLYHTQSRPDRDDYVDIHWEEIPFLDQHNFYKESGNAIGPYDFDSVMHYSSFSFSSGDCASITKKGAPDHCNLEADGFISRRDDYSQWNYVSLAALYCLPRLCKDNCASEERCASETVQRNLRRLANWEETGSKQLPADEAVCGDNYLDEGEECDDSEDSYCDPTDCVYRYGVCGDGYIDHDKGEECDRKYDPEEVGYGNSAECDWDCTLPVCGDGEWNEAAGEECDEGTSTFNCNSDCTFTRCGDGVINRNAGEQCDGQEDCDELCRIKNSDQSAADGDNSSDLVVGCSTTGSSTSSQFAWLGLALLWLRRRRIRA